MNRHRPVSRRQFLGQASCAALGSASILSTLMNLRMASTAAAQSLPLVGTGDYKAMVCLFFAGGSDSFNFLIPRGESEHAEYAAIRKDLAIPRADLLPINPLNGIGKNLGLHPGMPEIQSLFENGDAAWVTNVGTLIEPTTRAQFDAKTVDLPLGLYSHADQIRQWQTSVPQSSGTIGWGGRTADLLHSLNDNERISMNFSLSGSNVWQSGNRIIPYSLSTTGAIERDNWDATWNLHPARNGAVESELDRSYRHLFEQTFAKANLDAIEASAGFTASLEAAPDFAGIFTDGNYISERLRMAARAIATHEALGMRRQTFFITFGGWDHHDEVLGNMGAMVPIVSKAIGEFWTAIEQIGAQQEVTLFTASDFGRTLTSNGAGSDHAWGGNHLLVGGALNGRRIFGTYPDLFTGNPQDTGRGRLIPTTSVDEYFGELALWFGVSPGELPTVLPNVENFFDPAGTLPLGLFGA